MSPDSPIPCGPFELIEPVGKGGIAEVWRAVHRADDVEVAVKILKDATEDNSGFESFQREVQAVAALNHPHIIKVFHYGLISEDASAASGGRFEPDLPYLAMELAESQTLDELIITNWTGLQQCLLQILDALAYAHARQVIHRDLKPANVLVARSENRGETVQLKLSDFGLVHAMTPDINSDTRHVVAAAGGTPYFMPPEQFLGEWRNFGPSTDIYALGCLAYTLACEQTPFRAENVFELARKHQDQPRPELNPQFPVPNEFENWVQKAMARDPSERFRRAADAAWALEQLETPDQKQRADKPGVVIPKKMGEQPFLSDRPRHEQNQGRDETAVSPPPTAASPHADPKAPQTDSFARTVRVDESGNADGDQNPPGESTMVLPDFNFDRGPDADKNSAAPSGEASEPTGEVPPIPDSWHVDRQQEGEIIITGAGRDLFDLREIPLVDRDEERNAIWHLLNEVATETGPRVVMLQGDLGTGKSHLARWICRRAHETGAGHVFRAPYTAQGGPNSGLSHMLDLFFTTWQLDRKETHERVVDKLESLYEHVENKDLHLEYEARAITEIIRPTPRGQNIQQSPLYSFCSLQERFGIVARLLQTISSERPVIIWIDNAHWGEEALQFVEYILNRPPEFGPKADILTLMTIDTDQLDDSRISSDRFDELSNREDVVDLGIDPLPDYDHQQLIRQLLSLAPELVAQVQSQTDGNPLFTRQLLGDWVERDVLEVGEDGFLVKSDDDLFMPRDIYELWADRTERLLNSFPEPIRKSQKIALEAGAILGHRVLDREWRRVCDAIDVEIHSNVLDALYKRGFIKRTKRGWRFQHDFLRQWLENSAREHGRYERLHQVCADVLQRMHENDQPAIQERLASHWIAAGQPGAALDPLLTAIEHHLATGYHDKANRLLRRRRQITDQISEETPSTRNPTLENKRLQAVFERNAGNLERAEQLVDQILEADGRDNPTFELGRAMALKGTILCDRKHHKQSLSYYEQSYRILADYDRPNAIGQTLLGLSWAQSKLGEFESARSRYREALDCFRKLDNQAMVANTLRQISSTWLEEGEVDKAFQTCRRALTIAQNSTDRRNEAKCWNALGEKARAQNDLERAKQLYATAAKLWNFTEDREAKIAELNIALVELQTERYERADRQLHELETQLREIGYALPLPTVLVARSCCQAALEDWDGWEANFEKAEIATRNADTASRDIPRLAEKNGDILAANNRPDLAKRAYQFARRVYDERIGDAQKAENVPEPPLENSSNS